MALSVLNCETSLTFQTGQDVLENNGLILFGMSPGNSFFQSEVVEDYVWFLGKEKRRIVVFIPQEISQHTFIAMGCKHPRQTARKQSNRLRKYFKQAIEKVTDDAFYSAFVSISI